MSTVDTVVTALAAGAAAGAKDTATAAVKDGYAALLAALRRRFGPHVPVDDPERLAPALAGLAEDDEPAVAARDLLRQLDSRPGYRVDARGAQGVQIGDHNTMTAHFGPPPER